MKKFLLLLIITSIIFLFGCDTISTDSNTEQNSDIESLQSELYDLDEMVMDHEEYIYILEERISELESQIEDMQYVMEMNGLY